MPRLVPRLVSPIAGRMVGGADLGNPPPLNTVAPVVSGDVAVGEILSCTTGTWENALTYAYQWRADGVDLSGETSNTYTLVTADIGADIDCVVTATGSGGSVPQASNSVGPITGDPSFASVVLLLQFAGADGSTSFVDLSNSAKAVTATGNAQVDTAQSKFGGTSLLLDGTGDFLELADSPDWLLSSANSDQFTVECWIRPATIGNPDQVIGQRAGGGNAGCWSIVLLNAGKIELSLGTAGGDVFVGSATGAIVTGAWQHVAADKDAAGKVRLYVGGVMVASNTPANSALVNFTTVLTIGSNSSGWASDGWIDDVRVTKGVARYASDGGFTPPTEAFPTS